MTRNAIVVETTPDYAVVEVTRESACAGCHNSDNCSICKIGLTDHAEMRSKAANPLGAREGDTVQIETDSATVLRYSAAVFLLPLALGAAGYIIGYIADFDIMIRYIISLIGFAAAFVILKIFLEKRAAKRLDVRITQIIARKAAPEEKYVE
ncbi:MAG: SoxR reducing system RseC family protein [Candidatus Flemingibacterium sp.]|nr:SoxR reducing system RseC family protein [Candidatus Flemingibacterium sp.]